MVKMQVTMHNAIALVLKTLILDGVIGLYCKLFFVKTQIKIIACILTNGMNAIFLP